VKRGRAFALRALVVVGALVAGDIDALAGPRKEQPCSRSPQNNRPAPQRRCSDRAFRLLYAQVHKYCHLRERKCSAQADACEVVDKKIRAGYGCTDAREVLQSQCYRAGDPGYTEHMGEIRSAYISLRRCIDVQNDQCVR
jgi:hypothetical protein